MLTTNYNEEQLVKGIILHGPDILSKCLAASDEVNKYLKRVSDEFLDYPIPLQNIDTNNWFIPESYKGMDIELWLHNQCQTSDQTNRVQLELELYKHHGMIPVLNAMKYIVDTLRKHNVVWGVGRGSSVASYVLYLIGVHKIDSIKYNLPIEEFFKGE